MTADEATERLRRGEAELRAIGVARLSLFGSTARGEQRAGSDVDIAATVRGDASFGLFKLIRLESRLEELLGQPVDLVTEPSDHRRLQAEIDRDRVPVF